MGIDNERFTITVERPNFPSLSRTRKVCIAPYVANPPTAPIKKILQSNNSLPVKYTYTADITKATVKKEVMMATG